MLGWIGMTLLLSSYLMPRTQLLVAQFFACLFLLAYALSIEAVPFVVMNAVCVVLIAVRLVR